MMVASLLVSLNWSAFYSHGLIQSQSGKNYTHYMVPGFTGYGVTLKLIHVSKMGPWRLQGNIGVCSYSWGSSVMARLSIIVSHGMIRLWVALTGWSLWDDIVRQWLFQQTHVDQKKRYDDDLTF